MSKILGEGFILSSIQPFKVDKLIMRDFELLEASLQSLAIFYVIQQCLSGHT